MGNDTSLLPPQLLNYGLLLSWGKVLCYQPCDCTLIGLLIAAAKGAGPAPVRCSLPWGWGGEVLPVLVVQEEVA